MAVKGVGGFGLEDWWEMDNGRPARIGRALKMFGDVHYLVRILLTKLGTIINPPDVLSACRSISRQFSVFC